MLFTDEQRVWALVGNRHHIESINFKRMMSVLATLSLLLRFSSVFSPVSVLMDSDADGSSINTH